MSSEPEPSPVKGVKRTSGMATLGSINMDNSGEVVTKIANLFGDMLTSDVILVVGEEKFPAHKVILCASSDVFKIMLINSSWTESQEKRVILKELPACAAVFSVFLKYLYTGKVQVDFGNVIPMLQLADKYNVEDLLHLGLEFMTKNICIAAKLGQLVSWYQFAVSSGYKDVADLCLSFIKWNFFMVSSSTDWPNMELDSLVLLLSFNDLVVKDETVVFRKVEEWLEEQQKLMLQQQDGDEIEEGMEGVVALIGESDDREENCEFDEEMAGLVRATMAWVRFPMMSPGQIADLLLSPMIKKYMSFFWDRMSTAVAFQRDHPEAVQTILASFANGDRLITPRLYTEDNYCESLSVDNFLQLPTYHCRSLVFTSHEIIRDCDTSIEWMVNIYPKGVWFQKCFKIFLAGAMQEVPERVLRTVRVSISTTEETERRVKIGVLVVGVQDGFEHIRHVRTRNYIFDKDDQIVNLDDMLSFDELNIEKSSNFLSGPNKESLKIHVTITPLHKNSSLRIP